MKYRVIVTRDATESAVVEVEADSPAEADNAALDLAAELMDNLVYALDEGNYHEPYIGAPGEAEPVVGHYQAGQCSPEHAS